VSGTLTALGLSFLERYTALALGIASTIVLSRILTPEDTGLFSIGVALTALLAQFRDFGVGTILIQTKDLTDDKFRTTLGVSAITALLIMTVIVLGSGPAGDFYEDPGVTRVMLVTALSFAVIPFNSIVMFWLRRQMQFTALCQMTITGALCHAATGVGLALLDFGYMSLAWATVANSVGTALVAFFYRPRQFSYVPSLKEWRTIASLGLYQTVASMCQEIALRSADLLTGRALGMAAVGHLSRANGLVSLVNQSLIAAIMPVALSLFALKQRSGDLLGVAYLRGLGLMTAVAWPAFAFLGLMAFPLIRILFGDQWDVAVEPARLIALAAMVSCLGVLHPIVYQATGSMRQLMNVQLLVTPLKLAVLFGSVRFGLPAVAAGLIVNSVIDVAISQVAVNRIVGTRLVELGAATWKSLVATIASAAGPLLVLVYLPPTPDQLWQPLILAALGGGLGWLGALFALRHPIVGELLKLLPRVRRTK